MSNRFPIKFYTGPLLSVVLAGLALFTYAGTTTAQVISIPMDVKDGVTAAVIWGVSWVFLQLITLVPWLSFLDQFKIPLATSIAAEIISLLEVNVPGQFEGVTVAAIVLVLALLALLETVKSLSRMDAPGFRSRA